MRTGALPQPWRVTEYAGVARVTVWRSDAGWLASAEVLEARYEAGPTADAEDARRTAVFWLEHRLYLASQELMRLAEVGP